MTHIEHQTFETLDRPKSPAFTMDSVTGTPPFNYVDAYQGFDYPYFAHSPLSVPNNVSCMSSSPFTSRLLPPADIHALPNSAPTVPASGASPRLPFELNLSSGLLDCAYSSGASFTTGSPAARPFTPPDAICPPALSHPTAGELSSDSMSSTRKARSNSLASSASPGSAHGGLPSSASTRGSHRYNPLGGAQRPSRERKAAARRQSKDDFASDDEEEDFNTSALASGANSDVRREEIRRQRIESEQRRRDELRDGYRRLKEVLPVSNQKSSKVSLLDRGEFRVALPHGSILAHVLL